MTHTSVVIAGPDGVLVNLPQLRIVGTPHEQDGAGTAAAELAAGAARVELCGTLGLITLAELLADHPDADAGAVLFAGATGTAGTAGGGGRRAVLFLGATLDPFLDRVDAGGVVLLPVPDDQSAGVVAAHLAAAQGVTRFELLAGLGLPAAANVLTAVPAGCAVGLALYP